MAALLMAYMALWLYGLVALRACVENHITSAR